MDMVMERTRKLDCRIRKEVAPPQITAKCHHIQMPTVETKKEIIAFILHLTLLRILIFSTQSNTLLSDINFSCLACLNSM